MSFPEDHDSGRRFWESYSSHETVRSYQHPLFGTWNSLLLVEGGGDETRDPAHLDRAAADAFALMERHQEELSRFEPESEVSLLNALAGSGRVGVSETLWTLLQMSRRFREISRGAFDPTMAPLMRAWGFDGGQGRVPSPRELEELGRQCGLDKIELHEEDHTVSFRHPGVAIDLGAIGKGWIVDRAVERLRDHGVGSGALISGRSTIVVWGEAPDGDSWRIGVASPLDPDETLLRYRVQEGAISTSAAYENRFEADGKTYGHVFDPRTRRPVQSCLGATVWTPRAVDGDVASTTIFVLGSSEAREVLPDFGRISAVVVEEDTASWGGLKWSELSSGEPGWQRET